MMMTDMMDESLLQEFIVESREHLETIEPDLLVLETQHDGADQETINRIFRAIHSIKGASGFFGLEAIKNLSHVMENLLMWFRDGKMFPSPASVDPLLKGVDLLRTMLSDVGASESVPYQPVRDQLQAILSGEASPSNDATPTAAVAAEAPEASEEAPQDESAPVSGSFFDYWPEHVRQTLKQTDAEQEAILSAKQRGCCFYYVDPGSSLKKIKDFVASVGDVIGSGGKKLFFASVLEPELLSISFPAGFSCQPVAFPDALKASLAASAPKAAAPTQAANPSSAHQLKAWGFGEQVLSFKTLDHTQLLQLATEGHRFYIAGALKPSIEKTLSDVGVLLAHDGQTAVFATVLEPELLLQAVDSSEDILKEISYPEAFAMEVAINRQEINRRLLKTLDDELEDTAEPVTAAYYEAQYFDAAFYGRFAPNPKLFKELLLVGCQPYILNLPETVEIQEGIRQKLEPVGTILQEQPTCWLYLTVLERHLLEHAIAECKGGKKVKLEAVKLPKNFAEKIEELRHQLHLEKVVATKAAKRVGIAGPAASQVATTTPNTATQAATANKPTAGGTPTDVETVRVRIDLLDRLMDMAGELVLCRNQLVRSTSQISADNAAAGGSNDLGHQKLSGLIQNLSYLTTSLQDRIMQMRMQTLDNLFKKFPRLVRDLSQSLNKEIQLEISGQDTELDKSIIEMLSDPLTHMIRNCCDHAIENPDDRARLGKPRKGTIQVKAYHEVGQIHVAVIDDGRGIDPTRVAAKALEKGLVTEDQLHHMSNQEIIQLIFLPGFSTAETVSEVSGRGVGMDVVRSKIEKVGGTVAIHSEVGRGSSFIIKIPLTLAIISCLIVSLRGKRFAVPQINIVEILRLGTSDRSSEFRIEHVGDSEVVQHRGELLPLVRLEQVLNWDRVDTASHPPAQDGARPDINILVLRHGDYQFGLVVDRIEDMEEVVVKPLSRLLQHTECFSGNTILGDGAVVMIIDPQAIVHIADLHFTEGQIRASAKATALKDVRNAMRSVIQVLLFKNHDEETFSVKLEDILRIEQIDLNDVQIVGGREFVECRSHMLAIMRLEDYLPVRTPEFNSSTAYLLLPKAGHQKVGLLITEFLDEMEVDISDDEQVFEEREILSSVLVDHHLVPLLDVNRLLHKNPVFHDLMENAELFEAAPADPDDTSVLASAHR